MTKNIIIGVLVLLSAFFATYASIKTNEAEMHMYLALENEKQIQIHMKAAQYAEQRAVEEAARALIEQRKAEEQKEIAADALAKCK